MAHTVMVLKSEVFLECYSASLGKYSHAFPKIILLFKFWVK